MKSIDTGNSGQTTKCQPNDFSHSLSRRSDISEKRNSFTPCCQCGMVCAALLRSYTNRRTIVTWVFERSLRRRRFASRANFTFFVSRLGFNETGSSVCVCIGRHRRRCTCISITLTRIAYQRWRRGQLATTVACTVCTRDI